ncbi:MAG: Flp family type IVb pilin [Chloroflexi bacterium]|nr:Flp family type IVb pilin [Chloroflexota bacterium]PWB43422.1 MAG: Flp family type IVb pilin [Dehalococcoidia bacterium]
MNLRQRRRTALKDGESGQSMVEYALVTALIAVVAIVAVETLGDGVVAVFENIASAISDI